MNRGTGPSPRSNHVAALYDDRILYIFGGSSKSKTFNDLYSLDFETVSKINPPWNSMFISASNLRNHFVIKFPFVWYCRWCGQESRSEVSILHQELVVAVCCVVLNGILLGAEAVKKVSMTSISLYWFC